MIYVIRVLNRDFCFPAYNELGERDGEQKKSGDLERRESGGLIHNFCGFRGAESSFNSDGVVHLYRWHAQHFVGICSTLSAENILFVTIDYTGLGYCTVIFA